MTGKQKTEDAENSAGVTPEAPGAAAEAETREGAQPGSVAFPYSAAGAVFTAWFNDRVHRLHSPTAWVGTRLARVIELHPDGRLEVEVETEALEPERQFVQFEAAHIDRFLLKFAALGAGAGRKPGP